MPDLDLVAWSVVALCAFMVGVSKTGIPGAGILVVPLGATVLPALTWIGLLLGILILADLFAIIYHRRNAEWRHIVRILPATLIGLAIGYFALRKVNNEQLKPIIGLIVLVMLAINYWRTRPRDEDVHIPTQWWFAGAMGIAAGTTTMMAHAAGPVMTIYLLAMRLPKIAFVGTSAWFFFIVNWIKVPFNIERDMVTAETVLVDLMMLPAIAAGAIVGIFFLQRIGQKAFNTVVQILAAAAAVKLLF